MVKTFLATYFSLSLVIAAFYLIFAAIDSVGDRMRRNRRSTWQPNDQNSDVDD